MRAIFVGSNGLRAGWRLAIYLGMVAAMALAAHFIVVRSLRPAHLIGVYKISPWAGLRLDLPLFAFALLAAAVMSRIERLPMGSYGLPWREAFGGRFWLGALIGSLSVSLLVGGILILQRGRFDTISLLTPALIGTGALYALTFLAVAFAEEFLYRGYSLATLAQGIGLWPAAAVLSVLFGATHLLNHHESPFGIAQAALFGFVFCYVLRRTGSLWLAVGYHFAWDWGETFLYGVPDSGRTAAASLFHVTLSGPVWLTGGTAGPEGSVFSIVALLALVPLVRLIAPQTASARIAIAEPC